MLRVNLYRLKFTYNLYLSLFDNNGWIWYISYIRIWHKRKHDILKYKIGLHFHFILILLYRFNITNFHFILGIKNL